MRGLGAVLRLPRLGLGGGLSHTLTCLPLLLAPDQPQSGTASGKLCRGVHTEQPWIRPRPSVRSAHGHTWQDEFRWLEAGGKRVQRVLDDEAAAFRHYMEGTEFLQASLLESMLAQLPDQQATEPESVGGHEYLTEQSAEAPHRRYLRRAKAGGGVEVLLDEGVLATEYGALCSLIQMKLSRDGSSIAYTVDPGDGSERLQVHVQRIGSAGLGTRLPQLEGSVSIEWSHDGSHLYCTRADALGRPSRVERVDVSAPEHARPECICEEPDAAFWLDIGKTKDWRYLVVSSNAKRSSEVRVLDWEAGEGPGKLRLVHPRSPGLEYFVEHADGHFYMLSNAQREDGQYSLFRIPAESSSPSPPPERWECVLPAGTQGLVLEDFDAFRRCLAVYARDAATGLPRLALLKLETATGAPPPPLPVHLPAWATALDPGANADFEAASLRVTLSSPGHVPVAADVDLDAGALRTLSGESPSAAVGTLRTHGRSSDGTLVPLTISHAGPNPPAGGAPAWVEVYGAYGRCLPCDWAPERAALLQAGWVLAGAHVRGGGELGRAWHAAGRGVHGLQARVDDLAACIDALVERGYTSYDRIVLSAHSAGGVVAAGLVQRDPGAVGALVLEAPFLDVLTVQCRPDLALTVHEYEEWGDPHSTAGFLQVQTACPYQGLRGGAFPPTLITASSTDTRVPVWGPLKWAARARAMNQGPAPILVAPDLHAGHAAHESQRLELAALLQAFAMRALGLA
ncbi:hypothetical protein ACKKBG_A04735 [Auxenochlorella protothecoides x Auxenochlorella symbiontica]